MKRWKLVLILIFICLVVLGILSQTRVSGINIIIDDQEMFTTERTASAVIGGVIISVEDVFRELGWEVDEYKSENALVLRKGDSTVFILAGRDRFLIRNVGKPDRLSSEMSTKVLNLDGHLMISAEALVDAINAEVAWDRESSTIRITTEPQEETLTEDIENTEGMGEIEESTTGEEDTSGETGESTGGFFD